MSRVLVPPFRRFFPHSDRPEPSHPQVGDTAPSCDDNTSGDSIGGTRLCPTYQHPQSRLVAYIARDTISGVGGRGWEREVVVLKNEIARPISMQRNVDKRDKSRTSSISARSVVSSALIGRWKVAIAENCSLAKAKPLRRTFELVTDRNLSSLPTWSIWDQSAQASSPTQRMLRFSRATQIHAAGRALEYGGQAGLAHGFAGICQSGE